jgi:hypothetical protein
MLICPEASSAQNIIAAVSADGSSCPKAMESRKNSNGKVRKIASGGLAQGPALF